jgi:hypothetical protein
MGSLRGIRIGAGRMSGFDEFLSNLLSVEIRQTISRELLPTHTDQCSFSGDCKSGIAAEGLSGHCSRPFSAGPRGRHDTSPFRSSTASPGTQGICLPAGGTVQPDRLRCGVRRSLLPVPVLRASGQRLYRDSALRRAAALRGYGGCWHPAIVYRAPLPLRGARLGICATTLSPAHDLPCTIHERAPSPPLCALPGTSPELQESSESADAAFLARGLLQSERRGIFGSAPDSARFSLASDPRSTSNRDLFGRVLQGLAVLVTVIFFIAFSGLST